MSCSATHVCHVVAGVVEGGLKKHLVDLTNAQLGHGWRVTVAGVPDLLTGLDQRAVGIPINPKLGRWSPGSLASVGRALRKSHADLYHAHATKATQMVLAARQLRLAPHRPMVSTLHGVKRNTAPYERADLVIAVSAASARQISRAPVVAVFNGVEPAPPWEGPLPAQRLAGPLVLAIGRLVEAKGFDQLLSEWKPDDPQLWIAGEGPQRPLLESILSRRNLQERVTLLGNLPAAASLIHQADLVVIPSRREGFSYVMAETLMARRPLVATRVPGPVDILPESLTCPTNTPEELVQLVRNTIADPVATTKNITQAWEFAAQKLTIPAMARATIDCYEQALRRSNQ